MSDQIICPYCKKSIPLTDALSQQIKEKYQKFYKQRLEEETKKVEERLKQEVTAKIKADLNLKLKDKINEAEELRKQNQSFQEQLLNLNKLIRQLKTENEQRRLEMEKKLAIEQEKIRLEETKKISDQFRLKILEKEKKLNDALKANEELRRKLEQGSQQIQGEVMELELADLLRREFPNDEIKEVPKGVRGADIIQIVKNKTGKITGSIIWEAKRTKSWTDDWISKLKDDQRKVKAELAVIISEVLPEEIKYFGEKDGVWVGNFSTVVGLAMVLRQLLIEVAGLKTASIGKKEKMDILWNYLTGIEFKQRIEAIIESFTSMQEEIEREKRWFAAKWSREEKNIRQVIDQTLGMHGDLQGIVGKSLPEIKGMEMLPEGEKNNQLF